MRRLVFIIGFIVGFNSNSLPAQDINSTAGQSMSGVYFNAKDYEKHSLSLSFACESSGKLKLHHLFSSKYADIIVGGKKTRLNKDSIFGYHNCKNEDYRFYKKYDEEFQILETNGIIIYLSYVVISPYNTKIPQIAPAYFFSKTIDSKILPLTLENLKSAYPDNVKFHDMLNVEFGDGEPLSAYSSLDKMYKVNIIFNKSNLK